MGIPFTGTALLPSDIKSQAPYKVDIHRPTLVLSGKRGKRGRWELYAGSRSRVEDVACEFDVVINCTGHALEGRKNIVPRGLGLSKRWVNPLSHRQIVLDWPDFGTPGLPLQFWRDLLRVIKRHRRTVLFCMGGHGRTGTAISILTMLAARIPGADAIEHIRLDYCRSAVETKQQVEYVKRLGRLAGLGKVKD